MINSRHLAILREVKGQGSVTSAADKLNVSQSALSHTIKKLEDRYGVKIWEKNGRMLRFTQAGEYLLQLADRVLPQLEQAELELSELANGRKGLLRIGMECHPCQTWLMGVTAPYLMGWPEVNLEVRTAFRFDGINALLDYEIDMLVTPDQVAHPRIGFTPVFDYELVLVVDNNHPLAVKTYIEPQDLINEELITIPVSKDRLDIYTQFLIPAKCQPRSHSCVETTELILQLVAAQRGVAVLPDWLVKEEGCELAICKLKLGAKGIYKSINLGIRQGEKNIDFIQGFISMAKEEN